jgi:hypothetical protein
MNPSGSSTNQIQQAQGAANRRAKAHKSSRNVSHQVDPQAAHGLFAQHARCHRLRKRSHTTQQMGRWMTARDEPHYAHCGSFRRKSSFSVQAQPSKR